MKEIIAPHAVRTDESLNRRTDKGEYQPLHNIC